MDYLEHKLWLVKNQFFYNEKHLTLQRLKLRTKYSITFLNVYFKDSELTITSNTTNFQDNSQYMFILFHGRTPESITDFETILFNIIYENNVVNTSLIRTFKNKLEKHDYILADTIEGFKKINNKEVYGIKYIYFKDVENYTIEVRIDLMINKFAVLLINNEEYNEVVILELKFPKTIKELETITKYIPSLFFKFDESKL